jgi:P4 family phage/plasmid primase-like protien
MAHTTISPKTETKHLDLAVAQKFITALTGKADTPMNFRTVLEQANGAAKVDNFRGTVAEKQERIERLSNAGAAIYFTVQHSNVIPLEYKGIKAKDIQEVRALFIDFDGCLPAPDEWHLQPSIISRNVDNKGHAYWLLSESVAMTADEVEKTLKRLVGHYNLKNPEFKADVNCTDIARILRLPGSWHLKGIPTLVTIDYLGSERYMVDEVMTGLAEYTEAVKIKSTNTTKNKPKRLMTTASGDPKDFDRMLAAYAKELAAMPENSGRNNLLNKHARTLAGLFPDRLDDIRATLTEAAIKSGLEPGAIEATIKSAMEAGIKKPITPYGSDNSTKLPALHAADLLVSDVLANIKFDTEAGQWWEYDAKGKWNPVKETRIFKLSQNYLRSLLPPFTVQYLNDCIRFAKSAVQVDGWSEASSLLFIPFTNGVLDIKAKQFLPQSPDYGFTWQLPREYSPIAGEWPEIDRFLDTLANGDQGLKLLAIAFCNAVLKGRSDLQKFLYLFGSGANGKGAFMTLLQMLIGSENIHSSNMSELNGNRFESANLRGKRLLLMTDEDKRSGGVGVFKAATGGDPIRFEQKGKDASHFTFKGAVVVAANNPTFVGSSDGGIKRRKVDFPCLAHIPEMDRKDMQPLFDADLTAFTTYLLSLDDAWVTETIRKASNLKAVKDLSRELAIREDSVAAFADAVEVTPGEGNKVRSLYADYRKFCEDNGLKPKSAVNFIPSLTEYCKSEGFEVSNLRDKKGKYLLGLTVKIPEAQ